MQALITTTLFILAMIAIYRFRAPIIARLRRFDDGNRAKHEEEARDRYDQLAHYRHTLRLAQEQVDEVRELPERNARTGEDVVRYTFQGEIFASRKEAEHAREDAIVATARKFYVELPAALTHRGKDKLN